MSYFDRNKSILQAILAGQSYAECVATHTLAKAAVMTVVRNILKTLKEHTDLSINICTSPAYLRQHREAILQALQTPIPTTPITHTAKAYLKQRFGKYYSGLAKEVAAAWSEVYKNFHATRESRDLLSMQAWLASEGYLVGDYISAEMSNFAYGQLAERVQDMNTKDGPLSLEVLDIHHDRTGLMLQVSLTKGDHKVTQKVAIKLQTP